MKKLLQFIMILGIMVSMSSCGSFFKDLADDDQYSYRRNSAYKYMSWEQKIQKTIDGFWYWFIALDDVYEGPIYDWKYESSKSMEVFGAKFKITEINGLNRVPVKR
ncbi:hypothetical protein PQO01_00140 [Lentisphaera marina]|uniref:hypothetical protein n=1 Tax=Lentisphaera marina TaxID=1111041 RepID=UPI002365280C|nr:hypothetical protein [Lentisphaera marina]MDD7983361.1 hypothetical protein [Lentisphaera marina]